MSFLAPFFLLAGGLLALPILFHLIRRQPKRSIQFSSLLFLQPSPPKISRRSRIDNWLLLLLRGLALLCIVAAFSRPFLRSQAESTAVAAARYLVVLVDHSASMRREDLWQQASRQLAVAVGEVGPRDRVALVLFADQPKILRGFDVEADSSSAANSAAALEQLLAGYEPTWTSGDLGAALVLSAGLLEEAITAGGGQDAELSVAVISDLQMGSSLKRLQGFEWPAEVRVRLFPVTPRQPGNGSVSVAGDGLVAGDEKREPSYRVSVSNTADAGNGRFRLAWVNAAGELATGESQNRMSYTVPPGTTRVLQLAVPTPDAVAVELEGDSQAFDNKHFVVVPEALKSTVTFIGQPSEDPRGDLFYYLQRVALSSPRRTVEFVNKANDDPTLAAWSETLSPRSHPCVILHRFPAANVLDNLQQYLLAGGTVLVVVDSVSAADEQTTTGISRLAQADLNGSADASDAAGIENAGSGGDGAVQLADAAVNDYALLTGIDFQSRIFRPLADARYSNFSQIQIWRHQVIEPADADAWSVLAAFDSGTPALLRRTRGAGTLYLLGMGWQPTESQLALSTKFVPLISGLIGDPDQELTWERHELGSPSVLAPTPTASLLLPSGEEIDYRQEADFAAVDRPGVYRYRDGELERAFVANIPQAESQTEPFDPSLLEQLGINLSDVRRDQLRIENQRQLRDRELESRQQWWQALLLAALFLLLLETLVSMWTRARQRFSPAVETSVETSAPVPLSGSQVG